jgi:hypothetical protein
VVLRVRALAAEFGVGAVEVVLGRASSSRLGRNVGSFMSFHTPSIPVRHEVA